MDQFIQQDPFGSDQDEWDGSDLSLGCDDSRRRQMSHATFREQLCPRINCDIAPNKPLLYSRLEIYKGL
ncbi:hypothetical protein SADUNF_SadunfMtG0000400 (mitochondrion) [Salix dunnii]|jgi:sigma54-dependent transcription regulator|uniref:Uncharacterized protein n=2 Tax=Salix TaxID=40685 RepID=A0A835MH45_9ROSI|nr:hypothetical protein SADUNF_SadunfMtG0000400 [Salix dunnii]